MYEERISVQAKRDFERDGVVILRGFFTPAEMSGLLDNLQRYIREVMPTVPAQHIFYQDKAKSKDINALLRLEQMSRFDPYFGKMLSQDLAPVAEAFLGEPVRPERADMFDKAARFGEATPPHQDGYYFKIKPPFGTTLWIPLERADEENGCVRYVRGSHQRGMRHHDYSGVFGFSLGITDYGPQDHANELVCVVDPGDVIVHHAMTIHRTDPNKSERTRRAMGFVYFAKNSIPDEEAIAAHQARVKKEWEAAGKF